MNESGVFEVRTQGQRTETVAFVDTVEEINAVCIEHGAARFDVFDGQGGWIVGRWTDMSGFENFEDCF